MNLEEMDNKDLDLYIRIKDYENNFISNNINKLNEDRKEIITQVYKESNDIRKNFYNNFLINFSDNIIVPINKKSNTCTNFYTTNKKEFSQKSFKKYNNNTFNLKNDNNYSYSKEILKKEISFEHSENQKENIYGTNIEYNSLINKYNDINREKKELNNKLVNKILIKREDKINTNNLNNHKIRENDENNNIIIYSKKNISDKNKKKENIIEKEEDNSKNYNYAYKQKDKLTDKFINNNIEGKKYDENNENKTIEKINIKYGNDCIKGINELNDFCLRETNKNKEPDEQIEDIQINENNFDNELNENKEPNIQLENIQFKDEDNCDKNINNINNANDNSNKIILKLPGKKLKNISRNIIIRKNEKIKNDKRKELRKCKYNVNYDNVGKKESFNILYIFLTFFIIFFIFEDFLY